VLSLLRCDSGETGKTRATPIAQVQHIFSHINMTYHAHHLVLSCPQQPALAASAAAARAVWLDSEQVEAANVGTGVKKVWAAVYGKWGTFEVGGDVAAGGGGKRKRK
jgi:A/G-specific adenine glycosylase